MARLYDRLRQFVRQAFGLMPKRSPTQASKDQSVTRLDQAAAADKDMALSEELVTKLMRQLEATDEQEYSCAETFAVLDEYVELAATEEEVAVLMPIVKHHLDICPDCKEKFEVLLRILQSDPSPPQKAES